MCDGGWVSNLGAHHKVQCTRSGGYLRKAPLCGVSCMSIGLNGYCTVDVDIALLHELAELGEPLGGVYFGHVDGTQDGRGMERSYGLSGGYMCRSCRVCARYEARKHIELTFCNTPPTPAALMNRPASVELSAAVSLAKSSDNHVSGSIRAQVPRCSTDASLKRLFSLPQPRCKRVVFAPVRSHPTFVLRGSRHLHQHQIWY